MRSRRRFAPLIGTIEPFPVTPDESPFHEVWLYAEELPPIEIEMGFLEIH